MKKVMMIVALVSSFGLSTLASETALDQSEESMVTLDLANEVSDSDDFDLDTYSGNNEVCIVGRYGRQGRLKDVYKQNENNYNQACRKALRICRRDLRGNQYCAVLQCRP